MIETTIKGITLKLNTVEGVFSPKGVDSGTLAMLKHVEFTQEDKLLDLGCGYGVVGLLGAKIIGGNDNAVIMCDIDERAIAIAKCNATVNNVENAVIIQSNGLDRVEDSDFTLILSNPPYHVDFSVPKAFIEKGFHKLKIGGKMVMVTKRKIWYKNKLISVFGGIQIFEEGDYFVFIAQKRSEKVSNAKPIKSKSQY